MAAGRIKGIPEYRGYYFVLDQEKGACVRCPDGDLVTAQYLQTTDGAWLFYLGLVGTPDIMTTLQHFADRHVSEAKRTV